MNEQELSNLNEKEKRDHADCYQCNPCMTAWEKKINILQASLDALHGAKFSDRSYHALKSRAEKAEEALRANTLLRKRAENDLEHANESVVREMNAHNAAWDAAIAEAGKPRGFCSGTNMRKNIVESLKNLKAEVLK